MASRPLRLGVLSTGRQDWGIVRSVCALAQRSVEVELVLFAGGMALDREHGRAADFMEADGFRPADLLDFGDGPAAAQAGIATGAVAEALVRRSVDALLLAGDRFETMAAAVAATIVRVPIVHLHGGEETQGAIDNALRHAITKLAHLHFVSHPDHAKRVIEMGEDPAAVHVVGAPGLDNLRRPDIPSRGDVEARAGLELAAPVVIVTLHPATLGADPRTEAEAVVAAMNEVDATYVITLPNNDPGAEVTREILREAAKRPRRVAVESLGERFYWALMKSADAMLGNSSSALIEAPALALPAVNVGARQEGRLRGPNVVDVGGGAPEIATALAAVLEPSFRASIANESLGLFGDGHAGEKILSILRAWQPPRPATKKHHPPA